MMATDFAFDIRERVVGRPQITTDAHKPYLAAIEMAFGDNVDYAQMHKCSIFRLRQWSF
jgi:hypothetical protein